jgi:hypothetical protein
MLDSQVPQFEDPALKAAVCRCFASECASSALRERIARSLAAEHVAAEHPSARPATGAMRINPASAEPATLPTLLPGFAMAAAMVLAIGGLAFILSNSPRNVPAPFQVAAVARHDGCCQAADHHMQPVPQASYAMMGKFLRQELNHPVLAADLTKDGWSFSGAAICPVGGVSAAHLLFRKGQESLSVFSLPASAVSAMADGQVYEARTADGHTVVARSQDGAVYCLVGRGSQDVSVDQLDDLLEAHRSEATVAAATGPRITVAGINREP